MANRRAELRFEVVNHGGQLWRQISLGLKIFWWAVTLQLGRRIRLHRNYRRIVQSNLFDSTFYLAHNSDVEQAEIDPLLHYLRIGWKEGRNPHPLFDVRFYLEQSPDVAQAGIEPIQHYLTKGSKKGRNPHPLFDSSFYLEQHPSVAQSGIAPLSHYLTQGLAEGYSPNRLFDTPFYLKHNPDVAAAGLNPLVHFVTHGAVEGRMPNPLFDPRFYYKKYPAVKRAKINPLVHYLERGAEEGCDPGPFFSTAQYLSEHPELKDSGINPLAHFFQSQRQSNEIFQVAADRPASRRITVTLENTLLAATSGVGHLDCSAASKIDLLLDLTGSEPSIIRTILEPLFVSDQLSTIISSATVLLPKNTGTPDTRVPNNWRLVPDPHPISAANEALADALKCGHHLLVQLGPVLPGKESIGALLEAFKIDPHLGIAIGRQSTTTAEILKLDEYLVDPQVPSLPRRVLDYTPEFYILPEILSPTFVLRDLLVSNLGRLDESYDTLAGALLDYLCYARRCGFRCVVLNRVIFPNSADADVTRRDILKLATKQPSISRAKIEFTDHSLHLHENLLAHAVSSIPTVRCSLLIDTTGLENRLNGTSEAVLGFCDGVLSANPDWIITLLVEDGPAQFHKLADRYSNWKFIRRGDRSHFTAALRPNQPWKLEQMIELHGRALFNFYTMLDNIAWDIFPAEPGLEATWNFLSEHADGILYISQYTRDHFAKRFPVSQTTPGRITRLSLAPADYKRPVPNLKPEDHDEFMLVIGNSYVHKHVGPTVDSLASAFPLQPIKVIGLKTHPSRFVEPLDSGQLPQDAIDHLYARARVIVFPSFYEGFGFPVIRGLSYGRTVIARDSGLLLEIASRYRGPGRLVAFRNEGELVDLIGRAIRGDILPEVPLGNALHAFEKPINWKGVASEVLRFIENQTSNVGNSRWLTRERAIRQFGAYSEYD